MPHKPDVPCSNCGKLMWRGGPKAGLAERPTCRPCRRLLCGVPYRAHNRRPREPKPPKDCSFQDCGRVAAAKGLCPGHYAQQRRGQSPLTPLLGRGNHRRVRAITDARSARKEREVAAPGLSQSQRKRLLAAWMQRQRTCSYCPSPCTTIDHVLPLVRGGTNHEGNLTPCCKRCNSSKAGWTVIEWRTGLRLPPMTDALPWCYPAPARPKPEPKPILYKTCLICGAPHLRKKYCSVACCDEANVRISRDRYRAQVGLPVDFDQPTRRRRVTQAA